MTHELVTTRRAQLVSPSAVAQESVAVCSGAPAMGVLLADLGSQKLSAYLELAKPRITTLILLVAIAMATIGETIGASEAVNCG